MGYRSEVSLVLTREAMSGMFKEIPESINKMIGYADNFLQKKDAFYLTFNHIKWYTEYGEISKIENYLSKLDRDQYHFIRLGENHDDVEERGGYYDNPFDTYVSRSIVADIVDSNPVNLSVFI